MALPETKISKPNLIHEFDKRIEYIRRTYDDTQLEALLKTLDQFSHLAPRTPLIKQKETPPQPSKKETPPSRNALFYLYVQRHERLCRLNVSKLSEAPAFELVCDFRHTHPRDRFSPVVCFNVESEIFMVGDVLIHREERPKFCKPFFNLFSIDAAKSPSFLPCPPTIARGFAGPKVDPLVVTLHGKIYVLALHLNVDQPSFEVFDNGKWETLPPPPYFPCLDSADDAYLLNTRTRFLGLYAWDDKIVVCLEEGISYCFDTKTVKWIDVQHIYTKSEGRPVLQCVAQYGNFLIAKPFFSEELVVYELHADGFPHFHQNLDGLEEMFADSPITCSTNSFIIPFEGDTDKFCFICSGTVPPTKFYLEYSLLVAVFRMTISKLDGKKKLSAELEAYQIYPFNYAARSSLGPHIYSAFLKRDNFNLDNLKADRSFGRACLN